MPASASEGSRNARDKRVRTKNDSGRLNGLSALLAVSVHFTWSHVCESNAEAHRHLTPQTDRQMDTETERDLVKHFKEFSTGLMYSADDCSTAERQRLE